MVDWSELSVDGESEFLIAGPVTREELEAESTSMDSQSLFDTRLKGALRQMIDASDDDQILVEAVIREFDETE